MEGWILILRSAEIFNYITHIHSLIAFKVKFILHSHKYMHKFLEIIECYTQELFVQIPFKNIVESLINWLTHALNSILGVQWLCFKKELCDQKECCFFSSSSLDQFSEHYGPLYPSKTKYKEIENIVTIRQTLSLIHPRIQFFIFIPFIKPKY